MEEAITIIKEMSKIRIDSKILGAELMVGFWLSLLIRLHLSS